MAEDGKRAIITSDGATKAKESRASVTTNKSNSSRGKKRAPNNETQDGIGSSKIRKGKGKEVKTSGIDDSDHDAHTQTERDRRKRMKDLFSCLQTFHSHLPPKVKRSEPLLFSNILLLVFLGSLPLHSSFSLCDKNIIILISY
jgi:hypothetical protein